MGAHHLLLLFLLTLVAAQISIKSCPPFTALSLNFNQGNITHPFRANGPLFADAFAVYGPGANCSWQLSAPPGNVVRIQLISSHLAFGDQLALYDGAGQASPMLAQFWGDYNNNPRAYYSSGRYLTVAFTSTPLQADTTPYLYYGFALWYNATTQAPVQCAGSTLINVAAFNGSTITTPLYPPDGIPSPYRASSNCSWILRGPRGSLMTLMMQNNIAFMLGDYLEIRDGESSTSPLIWHMSTQITTGFNITNINASSMFVNFVSSANPKNLAWQISFSYYAIPNTIASPFKVMNATSGKLLNPVVNSQEWSAYFGPVYLQTAAWQVRGNTSNSVIWFHDLYGFFQGNQAINVYDGPDRSYPLIFTASRYQSFYGSGDIYSSRNVSFVEVVVGSTPLQREYISLSYTVISNPPAQCANNSTTNVFIAYNAATVVGDPVVSNVIPYSANKTCRWNITTTPNATINVVPDCSIIYTINCGRDTLNFYQPAYPGGPLVLIYGGGYCNSWTITTLYNNLVIELVSGPNTVTSRTLGFRLVINSQAYVQPCANFTVLTPGQPLYVSYPYPPNQVCTWLLNSTLAYQQLTIPAPDMYIGENDRLEMYNGTSIAGKLIANFTGPTYAYYDENISVKGKMFVRFVAGPRPVNTFPTSTYTAFSLTYSASPTNFTAINNAPQCSGIYNLNATLGGFIGNAPPFGLNNSQQQTRMTHCTFNITAAEGYLATVTIRPGYGFGYNGGLTIYDGLDMSSIVFQCTSTGCYQYNSVIVGGWTRYLTVAYDSGSYLSAYYYTDQYVTPWVASYSSLYAASYLNKCPYAQSAGQPPFKGFLGFNLTDTAPFRQAAPGVDCVWRGDAGAGNIYHIYVGVYDLTPGATIRVYDGPSTSSPLLIDIGVTGGLNYNTINEESSWEYVHMGSYIDSNTVYTSTRNATVEFINPSSGLMTRGFQIRFTPVQVPTPCSGVQTINIPGTLQFGQRLTPWSAEIDAFVRLPADRICTWNLVAGPGAQVVFGADEIVWAEQRDMTTGQYSSPIPPFQSFRTSYDWMAIYDGATLLANISSTTYPPLTAALSSTTGVMKIVYYTGGGGYSTSGFEARYGAMEPPQPCPSIPEVYHVPAYGNVEVHVPRGLALDEYALAFKMPIGTRCIYQFVAAMGLRVNTYYTETKNSVIQSQFDFYLFEGNTTDPKKQIGNVNDRSQMSACSTVTFMAVVKGPQAAGFVLRVTSEAESYATSWSNIPVCAAYAGEQYNYCSLPYYGGVYDMQTIYERRNCSFIADPQYLNVSPGDYCSNITFPELRVVRGPLLLRASASVISFPKLETCNNLALFLGTSNLKGLNFTSLVATGEIQFVEFPLGIDVSFPALETLTYLEMTGTFLTGLDMPRLQQTYHFWVVDNIGIQRLNVPRLERVAAGGSLFVNKTVSLQSVDFTGLTYLGDGAQFGMCCSMIQEINLPNLMSARYGIVGASELPFLTTMTFPRLSRAEVFFLDTNVEKLAALSLPQFHFCQYFTIINAGIASLNMPALTNMGELELELTPNLNAISFPNWQVSYAITPNSAVFLVNTAVKSIDIPKYTRPMSFGFGNNPQLQYIGMCSIFPYAAPPVYILFNNSMLPCSGFLGLYASSYVLYPYNGISVIWSNGCNTVGSGTFGCAGLQTGGNTPPPPPTVVNDTCGLLTSCIQSQLDQNVGGYAAPMSLAAGEWIWDVVISIRGLIVTISGDPEMGTSLMAPDAAALVSVTANAIVTFNNIIFQGTTSVESMIQVTDATVIFNNCTLRDHSLLPGNGRGAAVFATGTGTLTFAETIVRNNSADEAGAIYAANGGVMTTRDSIFLFNVAREGGGGAIQLAPSVAVENAVSSFTDTRFLVNFAATTGGAIDSQVSINVTRVTARLNTGVNGGGAINIATLGNSNGASSVQGIFIDGSFEMNNAATGGAISALKVDILVSGTAFINNTATQTNGGAVSVSDCALAVPPGQSLAARSYGFQLAIADATMEGNVASGSGGGVYTDGVSVSVTRLTATDNAANQGAVLALTNSHVTLVGPTSFMTNYAGSGIVYIDTSILTSYGTSSTLLTFASNIGSSIFACGSIVTINNLISRDNVALAGTGINGQTTQFNIQGGQFLRNHATVGDLKIARAGYVSALRGRVIDASTASASALSALSIPASVYTPGAAFGTLISALSATLVANDLLSPAQLGQSSSFVIGRGGGVFVDDATYLNISGSTFDSGLADVGGVFFLGNSRSYASSTSSSSSVANSPNLGMGLSEAELFVSLLGGKNDGKNDVRSGDNAGRKRVEKRDLQQLITANVLTNNAATLYGPIGASQPVGIKWIVSPIDTARPGQLLASSGSDLSAYVIDYFEQTVTTGDPNVLQLQIGGNLAVAGQVAVLADPTGKVTFSSVYLLASSNDDVDRDYNLTVTNVLFPAATALRPIYVARCGAGFQLQGNATCQICPAGTASADGITCTSCSAGTYADQAGATACAPCPAESYAPQPGLVTCLPCAGAQPGSADCASANAIIVPPPPAFTTIGIPVIASILGCLICALLAVYVTYRLTARKTMKKYYLAEDTTVRADGDSTLQKEVKKMILSNKTRRIGGGLFADVFKSQFNDNPIVLKVLRGDSNGYEVALKEFRREAVALGRLAEYHHPAIIEMRFFLDRSPMCLGLEYASGGTVKKLLETRRLYLHEKVRIAAEAAAAMVLVHATDIVHLDLKTDNLLLDDNGHVKLADFGISRLVSEDQYTSVGADQTVRDDMRSFGGNSSVGPGLGSGMELGSVFDPDAVDAFTPQYVDPTRLVRKVVDPDGLRRADVFSFGSCLWAIYSQVEPFAGDDPRSLLERLKADPSLRPPPIAGCHICLDSLMHRCWHVNPEQRPAFPDIYANLTKCLSEHHGNELEPAYANFSSVRSGASRSRAASTAAPMAANNSTNGGGARPSYSRSLSNAQNPVFAGPPLGGSNGASVYMYGGANGGSNAPTAPTSHAGSGRFDSMNSSDVLGMGSATPRVSDKSLFTE